MPIEFRCPQCQKLLRVPSESAGAKAKCPECATITDIPRSELANGVQAPADFLQSQPANAFSDVTQPQRPTSKSPSQDPINPYSSPASSYAPSGAPVAWSLSNQVVPTPVDAGDVIRYAWEVWKANLGLLVGIILVLIGANIGLNTVQRGMFAAAQQGDEVLLIAVGVVMSIVNNLVQIFLGIGQAQIVLKLLRRQPAEFSELFGGGPLLLRVVGAFIVASIAMFIGVLACIIPMFLLAIFFWPYYWLIVDRKATAIESFGMAYPLAQANAGTTILLALASLGIILLGLLAFCVGILFAAPLVSLIWGTAYLMMSGQLADKPLGAGSGA